jgi:hypothetical protein
MVLLPVLISLFNLVFGLPEAEIVFVGDAMQHEAQLEAARRGDGTFDYTGCFASVEPFVKAADYAVVNLETPVGPGPWTGYPCFNAPGEFADALADAGFSLMLTANNHTLDRRDKGLRATLDRLDSRGIAHTGTYRNAAERDSLVPLIKDINGFKVAFLNYTYGTNGISATQGAVVDYIDRDLISRDIALARVRGAEIVTVAVHWGDEYKLLPNGAQRSLADFLVDNGVDLVIGGHPHVIQPFEMRIRPDGTKALVVYSLGNFISNMKTRDTRGGAAVSVTVERDRQGRARVADASYRLVFTVAPDGDSRNFRLVDETEPLPSLWHTRREAFIKAATDIFDAHNKNVSRRFF